MSRSRLVWFLFLFACVQQAFLFPDFCLIRGDRSNLFSGILCFISFISALAIFRTKVSGISSSEVGISIILSCLAFTSAALSITPGVSIARSFVIISSMIGGYWTSRLLLNTGENRLFFQKFCVILLFGVIALAFVGLFKYGSPYRFIDSGTHQVASRILLLSFAPISLLFGTYIPTVVIGVVVTIVMYCGLISLAFAGARSAAAIPFGLGVIALLFLKKKKSLLVILIIFLLLSLFVTFDMFSRHPDKMAKDYQGVAYRIENVFFSTYLALEKPFFGIGPSSPRDKYIDNYQIHYPFVSKKTFRECTDEVRTSENTIFTLLADLGFPFVILYLSALFCLIWKLVRLALRPPPHYTPAPLALLLAIIGSFVHFQVFDGPYLPQISWFFHVLLGMVLFSPPTENASE